MSSPPALTVEDADRIMAELSVAGPGTNIHRVLATGPLTAEHADIAHRYATVGIPMGADNPSIVKHLRASHHRVARLVAAGLDNAEVAAICGYGIGRISSLKGDPAFLDLVAFYQRDITEAWKEHQLEFVELAASLSIDALQEVQRRLDVTPESFNMTHLYDLIKLAADRTGHGPQTKTTNINVNVGIAQRLNSARTRLAELEASPPIEGESRHVA